MDPRWQDRPVLAAALRALVFAVPVVASVLAAGLMARTLGHPEGFGQHLLWWAGVLAASLGAVLVFDRAVRRLLPLAALLELSLIFPDRAPSRLGVALRSGSTRRLQAREIEALRRGDQEPAEAAHTILALASSLNTHDRKTRGHSERVRAYADLIAAEMDLDPDDRDRLRWAALLHDLGKLTVSPSTLNSHDALSPDDWEALRRHPVEGARLAEPLRPWLGPWALAIEQHHERYDGTGYPYGLAGEDLSLAARIVAVADSYDAMTSARSYGTSLSPASARQELATKAGIDFDPVVVRAFLNVGLGRVRWVMGPLAFFGVLPFLPGFGGVRHSLEAAGRTTAIGTVSLVASVTTAALVQPGAAPAPQVAGTQVERPVPRTRAAVGAPAPVDQPAVETAAVAAEVPAPEPSAAASAVPSDVAQEVQAAPATVPDPPAPPVTEPGAPPASPAGQEPVECREDGRSSDSSRPCLPPRWGHIDEGNPNPEAERPVPVSGR